MKKLLVLILLAAPLVASAQKRVSADDVRGEWKVVFHIEEEAKEADNAFARIALKAVSGLMDEIDIRLLFERDGVLTVSASAFGEEADTDADESSWDINRHGRADRWRQRTLRFRRRHRVLLGGRPAGGLRNQ